MKDQQQYLVVYRDSKSSRNKYYGPFVSDSMASEFMDQLPEPLNGGMKSYKLMSNFTFTECSLAFSQIIRERTQALPLNPNHQSL